MSSSTTIDQIAKNDLALYDGVSTTFDRTTSSGGTLSCRRIGEEVDICEVYGSGTNRNSSALLTANNAIGSREATYLLSPGTWSITADVTIPANVTLKVAQGAILSISTGITLTINGDIDAGIYQIFSWAGTGFIKIANIVREIIAEWFIPPSATNHTTYIKMAVDSTQHLVSGGYGKRPPVILTNHNYNIGDLTFNMGAAEGYSYVGMSLIGKAGGGNNESITLNVTGAAVNGIMISGNTGINSFANYCTLENITIVKDAYPGDANGDYGLKLRNVQFFRAKNVKIRLFGGTGLYVQESYFAWLDGFEVWNCYTGIQSVKSSWGASYGCTTFNFINPLFMGCKAHIRADGRCKMNFNGMVSDDSTYVTTNCLEISNQDNHLNFEQCWFEGQTGYIVNVAGTTAYPYYNKVSLKDCEFSTKTLNDVATYASSGKAIVTLDNCTDTNSTNHNRIVIIVGATNELACSEVLAVNDGTDDGNLMSLWMSNPECDQYLLYGPNCAAFRNKTVDAFNGTVHHRFTDDTHLTDDYKTDAFRSSIVGLWLSNIYLQQSGAGYGTATKINHSYIAPVSSTCNGTAGQYKVTSVTNPTQYSAGDSIIITGAGTAGGDLSTQIVNIEYDGSIIFLKHPIATTVTGAAMNLNPSVGDIKINTAPAAGGYIGWVCVTAGTPGTWKTFGAITA